MARAATATSRRPGWFAPPAPPVVPSPDDVAVTGWDDAAVAAQLGLTTVAQSLREQGAACALAALGQQPSSDTAPWSIVRRGGTRATGRGAGRTPRQGRG